MGNSHGAPESMAEKDPEIPLGPLAPVRDRQGASVGPVVMQLNAARTSAVDLHPSYRLSILEYQFESSFDQAVICRFCKQIYNLQKLQQSIRDESWNSLSLVESFSLLDLDSMQ